MEKKDERAREVASNDVISLEIQEERESDKAREFAREDERAQ